MLSHDEIALRDALQRLVDAAWHKPGPAAFSLPANRERDADLILYDAITELVSLRAKWARVLTVARRLREARTSMGSSNYRHGDYEAVAGDVLLFLLALAEEAGDG